MSLSIPSDAHVCACRLAAAVELHLAGLGMPWQSSPMASYLRVLTKGCVQPSADPSPPKLSASSEAHADKQERLQTRVLTPPHPHPATPHVVHPPRVSGQSGRLKGAATARERG